jgi:hypothetical protein
MSTKGSAYLERLAVKITSSQCFYMRLRNSVTPGLTRMYMLHMLPSISTGRIMSGFSMGLKEECTSVSSRSRTSVFFPISDLRYGPRR